MDDATATRLPEAARLLALIGIDRITGWLSTTAIAASAALCETPQLTAAELHAKVRAGAVTVVDVRSANEWADGHIPGAVHIPLGYLAERCRSLPATKPLVMQCQSGGRSAIATSLLERLGFCGVINLNGGYAAWAATGLPVEGTHEPQTARA